MNILEHIPLKDLTTMRVGGTARFFTAVRNESELEEALRYAKAHSLAIFVLGGGSNIVVSDAGFNGLVIKNEIYGCEFRDEEGGALVTAGAGESWDGLVEATLQRGLWGIENLSYIPGTVGAAPVQNIGAYGVELKDVLERVRAYDIETGEAREFDRGACTFSYRSSYFKETKKYIITSVTLRLKKDSMPKTDYAGIAQELADSGYGLETLSPEEMRRTVIAIRKRKLPDPSETPTAGSFFKNPEVRETVYKKLLETFPDMPGFPTKEGYVKIPLAWIIEHVCSMKGARAGDAHMFEKHALVMVHGGGARASDIQALRERIEGCVFEQVGIQIEPEVQFIGAF